MPHFVGGGKCVREHETNIVVNREIGVGRNVVARGYRVVDLLKRNTKAIEHMMSDAIRFTVKPGQKMAGVKMSIAKFVSTTYTEGNCLNCTVGLTPRSPNSEYVMYALVQSEIQPNRCV
ncbi:hypothetical protein RISK_005038 [Rhodopirellula islandica]|uniref:Uncharacterized protein n=1 Tax=Rhodopirellula islandica TaxID=595434 RepID=A0A0J1B7N6_RHOIS|nr:hypothetical protein RISK_005038 [Rhodopirellula islandica]